MDSSERATLKTKHSDMISESRNIWATKQRLRKYIPVEKDKRETRDKLLEWDVFYKVRVQVIYINGKGLAKIWLTERSKIMLWVSAGAGKKNDYAGEDQQKTTWPASSVYVQSRVPRPEIKNGSAGEDQQIFVWNRNQEPETEDNFVDEGSSWPALPRIATSG
jgi:hypothetical protein